jgi:hypothetical protein
MDRAASGELESSPPEFDDLPVILRGSKGPIGSKSADDLHALACRAGWADVCVVRDP